jgi:two-component system, OmpR family, sensor histidine kinase VicK
MEHIYYILRGVGAVSPVGYMLGGGVVGLVVLIIFIALAMLKHGRGGIGGIGGASADLGDLQAEKAKSSIILNAIEDGVVVIDTSGVIRLFNPAATKITGWQAADATGIDYRSIFKWVDGKGTALDPSLDPIAQAIKQTTTIRSNDMIFVSKSNNQYYLSIGISPLADGNAKMNGLVAVFRDITEEKDEEKRRAEFISTASHEMRTPVAAIEGYLALAMNDKVSKIDSKARSYLEKAHSSTQHLGKLFQDLLTSAKAEDGRLVSHPVVVEIGTFVDQMVESLRFSAEKKGLLMDYTVGAAAGSNTTAGTRVVRPLYYVHADPERLREVITNIFDNAVKYTPSGRISLGLTGNNEVVQIFVRDTGPGIPPEDVSHLFQKFYRVDSSATRTIGGTGLGLFICKKIVELYKGRIWAESELGKGSTFYINLPRLSTQRASELQTQEAQSSVPAPVTSLTTPV